MAKTFKVAKKSEIPADTGYHFEADGYDLAFYQVDGKVYCIDTICPHQGGPLHEGGVNDGKAICPWHGWEFDIKTGICEFNDAIKQTTYKVIEKGEDIYVEV